MIPELDGFADDITLSAFCKPEEIKTSTDQLNNRLLLIQKWGAMWQVLFAAKKTQFMVIWRAPVNARIRFGAKILSNVDMVDILGVQYDKTLSFSSHIAELARRAAGKIAALRRITWAVDVRALETLYKSQIRSVMEFAPLAWGGAAPTHKQLLDKMQRRVERIIYGAIENSNLQSLQHRRDVSGMAVMYKVHIANTDHLHPLRLEPRPAPRVTRAVAADTARLALKEPRCNTLHQQLQFLPTYCKMWNRFLTSYPEINTAMRSVQHFKSAVNKWLVENPSVT